MIASACAATALICALSGVSAVGATPPASSRIEISKSIVVASTLVSTASVTPVVVSVASEDPRLIQSSYTTTLYVLCSYPAGYSITVYEAAASQGSPVEQTSYTVTTPGEPGVGQSVSAAFRGGASYVEVGRGGTVIAQSTTPTGNTPHIVSISTRSLAAVAPQSGQLPYLHFAVVPNYA